MQGGYDSFDALGQRIGDEPWLVNTELAMFNAFDHNYFASDFHIKMFLIIV
jgi:hypothetical protein